MESYGDPASFDVLVAALNYDRYNDLGDEDATEKILKVAEALKSLGDSRAVGPLVEAIQHAPGTFPQVRRLARIAKDLGDEAGDLLLAGLANWDKWARPRAAIALAQLGDVRAVKPLIATLKEGGVSGRDYWAVIALGNLGDPRGLESLIVTLKTYDQRVMREAAADALGELGDRRAIDALIGTFRNPQENPDVCTAAAQALKRLGGPEAESAIAVEPLVAALDAGDYAARWTAADALGYLRDPRGIEPLIAALNDENHFVRDAAKSALKGMGDEAVDPLATAIKSASWWVREAAADVLGGMGIADQSQHAIEALIAILKDVDALRRTSTGELDDACRLAMRKLEQIGGSDAERAIEEYKTLRSTAQVASTPAIQPQTAQTLEPPKWWQFWK
jgi:HEAT repeat protein